MTSKAQHIQELKSELKESLEHELKIAKGRAEMSSFAPVVFEGYSMEWFHEVMCDALDRLSRREIRKLMIFVPPQHGKSTLSSELFTAKLLGNNPSEKILIGCYNKTKASEFVVKTNKAIKTEGYKELFPDTQIDGKDTDVYFEVNNGRGFVKAAGMDSGVTGTPATVNVIDDPFKGRNEANSITMRNRVWNTYCDDFATRLSDDTGITLMLFTRWHDDDIAGRIIDPNNPYYDAEEAAEWTVIVLQGLKESAKPSISTLEIDDPREVGEALWERKHGRKKLEKIKRTRPTSFYSLFQQIPTVPDGDMIKRDWFPILRPSELPFNINSVVWDLWIDGAWTKKETDKRKKANDPDDTGVSYTYFDKKKKILYIRNVSGVAKELEKLIPYLDAHAGLNGITNRSKVNIEMKASGFAIKPLLFEKGYNTVRINNKHVALGKFNRVEQCEPFLASGRVVLIQERGVNWIERFMGQCTAFPNGSHDDLVDVLAYPVMKHFVNVRRIAKAGYKN